MHRLLLYSLFHERKEGELDSKYVVYKRYLMIFFTCSLLSCMFSIFFAAKHLRMLARFVDNGFEDSTLDRIGTGCVPNYPIF